MQRHKLQLQLNEAESMRREQENQAASTQSSSIYSYFGFSGSSATQDYLAATSVDRSKVEETGLYKALKEFYIEMYVLGYTHN